MPRRRNGARRPSADWRIRPRAAPDFPPPSPPRPTRLAVATSSSSAAAPPARPSPRCWPSSGRDVVVHREGAPPALSHRRVAAAGQRRPVRPARPARAGRGDRHAEVRRRVRLARPRASPVHRVRRGLGQVDAVRLAGAALASSTRSSFATPPPKGARTFEGERVREVAFDGDGATVAGRARRRRPAQLARRASSSTPRAATRCSPTSCAARRRTSATTARRSTATSPAPSGCPASSKATSRSSGSSTAGSGSSRSPTARPASAPSAGRTT